MSSIDEARPSTETSRRPHDEPIPAIDELHSVFDTATPGVDGHLRGLLGHRSPFSDAGAPASGSPVALAVRVVKAKLAGNCYGGGWDALGPAVLGVISKARVGPGDGSARP